MDAILPPYLIAIIIPLVIFAIARITLPNARFEFDFDVVHSTFFHLLPYFDRLAWRIFAFGMVGAFAFRKFVGPGSAAPVLLTASIYALLFIVWMARCYESYLHARYPKNGAEGVSSYTLTNYCVTLSLAGSSLILFIVGVAMAMRSM